MRLSQIALAASGSVSVAQGDWWRDSIPGAFGCISNSSWLRQSKAAQIPMSFCGDRRRGSGLRGFGRHQAQHGIYRGRVVKPSSFAPNICHWSERKDLPAIRISRRCAARGKGSRFSPVLTPDKCRTDGFNSSQFPANMLLAGRKQTAPNQPLTNQVEKRGFLFHKRLLARGVPPRPSVKTSSA